MKFSSRWPTKTEMTLHPWVRCNLSLIRACSGANSPFSAFNHLTCLKSANSTAASASNCSASRPSKCLAWHLQPARSATKPLLSQSIAFKCLLKIWAWYTLRITRDRIAYQRSSRRATSSSECCFTPIMAFATNSSTEYHQPTSTVRTPPAWWLSDTSVRSADSTSI